MKENKYNMSNEIDVSQNDGKCGIYSWMTKNIIIFGMCVTTIILVLHQPNFWTSIELWSITIKQAVVKPLELS